MAYVYPKAKRETRDLLRRRSFFVRQRAQLIAHIQNTNRQYNLPPFAKKLTYKGNRSAAIADRFEHPSTQLIDRRRPRPDRRLRHADRRAGDAPGEVAPRSTTR